MKRVSDETFVRLRDAGLLGLEESIRVYEWLEAHKGKPENPVFQFVFRSYYRIDNAGLTSDWKVRYFEFLSQRERSLRTILEGLYHIQTKKKVKSLQVSFATKLLHTLDTSQPIYDSKVTELLGLPVKRKGLRRKHQHLHRRLRNTSRGAAATTIGRKHQEPDWRIE